MKNFEFINIVQEPPLKKALKQRLENFNEIYQPLTEQQSREQASRCLDCGTPYCSWQCPVNNLIPKWLALLAERDIIAAAEKLHETNSLPEVCGRVCPQDRLCEGSCTLTDDFGAVTIGSLEQYIVDQAFAAGWQPRRLAPEIDKRVAVIGAGPAGLACANVLRRYGVKVAVFDRHAEIGGLLSFGIPEFKLEKKVIARRREIFEAMGIEFFLKTEIGKDLSFNDILKNSDAVFLGIGAEEPLVGSFQGETALGFYQAIDYLVSQNNYARGDKKNYINLSGRDVIIIGAGDTAMDCVRTALRQGASRVRCVYRRDESNMPGSRREFINAKEEGGEFIWQMQPLALEHIDGVVTGLKVARTELVDCGDGRLSPQLIQHSESVLQCDVVVAAFGFEAKTPDWLTPYLHVLEDNHIFTGGDYVNGADLVVTAIASGQRVARQILTALDI